MGLEEDVAEDGVEDGGLDGGLGGQIVAVGFEDGDKEIEGDGLVAGGCIYFYTLLLVLQVVRVLYDRILARLSQIQLLEPLTNIEYRPKGIPQIIRDLVSF